MPHWNDNELVDDRVSVLGFGDRLVTVSVSAAEVKVASPKIGACFPHALAACPISQENRRR
jgi:hypothetical protein